MTPDRYHADGDQAAFEPGARSRVLRNRLGIPCVRAMQRAESAALLAMQEWTVADFAPHHRFMAGDTSR